MTQKHLSIAARIVIILFAVLGLAFYGAAVPIGGLDLLKDAPELQYAYLPWLIFMELMVIPDYAVLVLAWQVAVSLGHDKAFIPENARRLKLICMISLATTAYFFLGNTVFFFLNMNHPSVYLLSFVLSFIGLAISAAAAILSTLARKAADLQEESKLTI